ncbi:MAG: FAD-dependent oxidoreductase [Actinobacteria bacterium]|nr:FAD-dependent oxidoreductase [Actinomycetota bacterium]
MKIVILGNSAAAVGAVEEIRRIRNDDEIQIYSAEPYLAYSKPMLAHVLSNEFGIDNIGYRNESFYKSFDVKLNLSVPAISLDVSSKKVHFADGANADYDRLLISTGAHPLDLQIPNLSAHNKFYLTTIQETLDIAKRAADISDAVVVGAGFIGLNVAEALVRLGKKVVVVELADRILPSSLDYRASDMLKEKLETEGISFRLNQKIVSADEVDWELRSVLLENGEELPCEIVAVCIGVRPNCDFAREAGTKVNRGIIVNERMETNVPNVYAAGDVAEGPHVLIKENRLVPNWPNAYRQGRVAGANMIGSDLIFDGGIEMNSYNFANIPINSIGFTAQVSNGAEEYFALDYKKGNYRKIVVKDGKLIGALVLGDISNTGLIGWLIKAKMDVSLHINEILNLEYGLSFLPKEVLSERITRY